MPYQLIIQFAETLECNFDKLIELEDEFELKLGNDVEIDGHDIGSGQMNIFIITSSPVETFNKIKNILIPHKSFLSNMKAAYRDVKENNFTYLYPENLDEFKVI